MTRPADQQRDQLAAVFAALKGTSVGKDLGLSELRLRGALDDTHPLFAAKAPIVDHTAMLEQGRRLVGNPKATDTDLFLTPGLMCPTPPVGLFYRPQRPDQRLPLTAAGVAPAQGAMAWAHMVLRRQRPDAAKVTGVFSLYEDAFFERTKNIPSGALPTWLVENRPFKERWFGAPVGPNRSAIAAVGRSRAQALLAFVDQLQQAGPRVHTLVAHPRALLEMSLHLSQREGRYVYLRDLAPNLKLFLYAGQGFAVYRKELGYFFDGLSCAFLEMGLDATGTVALQEDLTQPGLLTPRLDGGVFYEFVPLDDVDVGGRFLKDFKRRHVGTVERNKDYLLVVSTVSGLVAYNTGEVVRVVGTDPLRLRLLRPFETLNTFNQRLTTSSIERLIGDLNDALDPRGVFIRDYMVGDNVEAKTTRWVLEISRAVAEVDVKLLRGVANRFHQELALENRAYARAYARDNFPPEMTFVPMGTFSNLPPGVQVGPFDQTPTTRRIGQVIQRAGQGVLTVRAAAASL